jgi:CRISPR type I-E-associated protein CasB/Cse2
MSEPTEPFQTVAAASGTLATLITKLVEIENQHDLGKLSALRAWWRPSTRYIALPVMGNLMLKAGVGPRFDDRVWTALPALFALHRLHTPRERFNLGATCRELAGDARDAFAPHFRRLLACGTTEELIERLRRLVQRAKSEGVAINYNQLGIDLLQWRKSADDAQDVKTRWAKEYFRVEEGTEVDKTTGSEGRA